VLDGSGPAEFEPPDLSDWPEIVIGKDFSLAKCVNLDRLSRKEIEAGIPVTLLL